MAFPVEESESCLDILIPMTLNGLTMILQLRKTQLILPPSSVHLFDLTRV
jgi:hypothetical protein